MTPRRRTTGSVLLYLGGRDDLLPLRCIAIDDPLKLGRRLPLHFKTSGGQEGFDVGPHDDLGQIGMDLVDRVRRRARRSEQPIEAWVSYPGTPASCMVGTSGASGERCAVVIASARSLPVGKYGRMFDDPVIDVSI